MEKIELISKVCDILKISDDDNIDLTKLYQLLKNYRTEIHPDKIIDSTLKIQKEEEFKTITPYLESLEIEIEKEQKSNLPAKIKKGALEKHGDVIMEITLRRKEDELLLLKNELANLRNQSHKDQLLIEDLRKQLTQKSKQIVQDKSKPKNLPVKIGMGFSGIIAVLSSINKDLFGLISKIPYQNVFPASLLPIIFWTIFCGVGFKVLSKEYRNRRIMQLLEELCTAEERYEFYVRKVDGSGRRFTETDVVSFVKARCNDHYGLFHFSRQIKKILGQSISKSDCDYLAQAFILKMEEEKLCEYKGVSELQKVYMMKDESIIIW